MNDWITKLITDAVVNYFKELAQDAINLFLSFLTAVNGIAIKVLDLPVVGSAILYAQILAGSVLAAKVAYEAWMTYIMRLDGDPDADPAGLLFRTTQAAALIAGVPWLVTWIFQLGNTITGDIAALPGVDLQGAGTQFQNAFTTALQANNFVLFVALGALVGAAFFLIIVIQAFIRAAELAVIAVSGPFMALGATNPNSQLFGSWWRELLNVCLAQAIQMFLIKVSFFALLNGSFDNIPMLNLFLFCGCLWVTYKSPSILKQYIYSTGVGRAAAGAVRSASSMVIMRKIFTRGV
ncbi:conjugal transfer protein TrbL family protein [Paenibacillus humicola]|uniref:conjugal transfer protein TrbL family protein n=1 Tax=Paenibacillus humicola TaxID=3110540 RepID=UPI00237B71EB|nr:conjugal transfer protein TrbL family protein [Paenibacillus humicola]